MHNDARKPSQALREAVDQLRETEGIGVRAIEDRLGLKPWALRGLMDDKVPSVDNAQMLAEALGLQFYLGPMVEQAQKTSNHHQKMVPPGFSEAQKTARQIQSLQPKNNVELTERVRRIDAIPTFDPSESMAAVREHTAIKIPEGTLDAWRIDQMAFPKPWLLTRNITAPALVPVPDDDMAPTFKKGDALLIDSNSTAIEDTSDPFAMTLDERLIIRRITVQGDSVFLRADDPQAMINQLNLDENGRPYGLNILGRVKAVISAA